MRPATLVLGFLLAPALSAAQVDTPETRLPFDAPESWAMKYFTSVTMMTGFGPPPAIRPGSARLGIEGAQIPSLSQRQRTVGFGGTKEEDLNKLPVWVRPRLTIGLPGQLSVTLGGVPPVSINGVRPSLLALSVARPIVTAGGFSAGLAVSGQLGQLEGDFTCSREQAEAGDDSELNPFQCQAPSRDVMSMKYAGAELSAGYRFEVLHGLTPFLSLAANYLSTSFRVSARYGGIVDRTALSTDGFVGYGTGGVTVGLTPFLDLSGLVFLSPLTVRRPPAGEQRLDGLVNGRLYLEWKIG